MARVGGRRGFSLGRALGSLLLALAVVGCDADYIVGATGLHLLDSPKVGAAPFAVALGDLDGDGAWDAAVLDATPQLCTLQGNNDGTLTRRRCVLLAEPASEAR